MATKKPITWFLTDRGRSFSFALVTGAGVALAAARFSPHTFFLQKYKNIVHYYNNGQPVQFPAVLQERYEKCLELLKVTDVHRKLISPFSVYGFDLFHAGSTSSRFGAAVGIPINFRYNSVEDVKTDDIMVNQKNVDWDSKTGIKLANALILPENVQRFAICREILMTQNNKIMYESVYPFSCLFFAYTLSQYLNRKLNLYTGPTSIRATMYSIIGLFSAGIYFLMKDMTEVYYETKVDKKLCELGRDFIESGVIFYEKILERNQALRELMGKEGEKKYSMLGNENFFIRQPRLALVHRKQFFEEKLKELSQEEIKKDEMK